MHESTCSTPKLMKFQGKPKDYTPKARIKNLLGYFFSRHFYTLFRYKLPFDRHDWVVDRCGEQVLYVIDFYSGTPVDGKPASFYLDVRPAITMAGIRDRLLYWWKGL